ncbi:hypothetical protein [Embleya sp. NPDC005575]|uniref:hypothetical protein n=1 Tax=Embleya sp. NPDC005575 TaxID=3156892 RepID=UPI0033B83B05
MIDSSPTTVNAPALTQSERRPVWMREVEAAAHRVRRRRCLLLLDGCERPRLLELPANEPGSTLIQPVPMTTDATEALAWVGAFGGGIEGVVSKPPDSPYKAGRTASGRLKWRASHTTEAIVIGVTDGMGNPAGRENDRELTGSPHTMAGRSAPVAGAPSNARTGARRMPSCQLANHPGPP